MSAVAMITNPVVLALAAGGLTYVGITKAKPSQVYTPTGGLVHKMATPRNIALAVSVAVIVVLVVIMKKPITAGFSSNSNIFKRGSAGVSAELAGADTFYE